MIFSLRIYPHTYTPFTHTFCYHPTPALPHNSSQTTALPFHSRHAHGGPVTAARCILQPKLTVTNGGAKGQPPYALDRVPDSTIPTHWEHTSMNVVTWTKPHTDDTQPRTKVNILHDHQHLIIKHHNTQLTIFHRFHIPPTTSFSHHNLAPNNIRFNPSRYSPHLPYLTNPPHVLTQTIPPERNQHLSIQISP